MQLCSNLLVWYFVTLISPDVAPEAPPSRAPQVILHPVLSEPGWVESITQFNKTICLPLRKLRKFFWSSSGPSLFSVIFLLSACSLVSSSLFSFSLWLLVRGQVKLIGAQIFGWQFQCEGRHDEYSETNVSMTFSSCYTCDANWIFTGSLRKPVVTGKQPEEEEEWWDAFRPRC